MNRIFADTSYYVALIHSSDAWHESAVKLFGSVNSPIVTTEYVIVELGAHMSRAKMRPIFLDLVDFLRQDESTSIIPASTELFESGFQLFRSRPDKDWSLTDCISFALMEREEISHALAADRHFTQAGFTLLMFK